MMASSGFLSIIYKTCFASNVFDDRRFGGFPVVSESTHRLEVPRFAELDLPERRSVHTCGHL
jgi:hypothetical protein